jgi:ribosome-associated protein
MRPVRSPSAGRVGGDVASKKSDETGTKATKKVASKASKPSKPVASKPAAAKARKVVLEKAAKSAAPRRAKAEPTAAPTARKDPPSKKTALAIADAGLDKKAVNIQIIDVLGKVDYADYLVVMSGRSERQVAALARGIAEDVEKNTGEKCAGIEGLAGQGSGAWVLMDFGDVVVHIFHDDVRGYYDLESLWIDAARVPVPNQPPA